MKNTEKNIVIYSVVKEVLGDPKNFHDDMVQLEFNCPSSYCKQDVNKYNLSYNLDVHIFNCWKCKYRGFVKKLIDQYGLKDQKDKINLVFPNAINPQNQNFHNLNLKKEFDEHVVCELPEGFIPLSSSFRVKEKSKWRLKAERYLKKRKVSQDIIDKYNIGYTETGPRSFRIIIPSYNDSNELNYYEARSYVSSVKPTYLKPDSPDKKDIIFNLKNINFNLPVYLIEGVFDMFPLVNAIPLLGKSITSEFLIQKLVEHNSKVIICLDEDAKRDAQEMYFFLESLELDVYLVDIKGDISSYYEQYDKDNLIQVLKNYKKLNFNTIFTDKLKIRKKGSLKQINKDFIINDFEKIKRNLNE